MSQFPESEYCTFLFADGRRCRALKMPTRSACIGHWKQDGQFDEDEAAIAELLAKSGSMSTPAQVNRALTTLYRLYAQGKIPHRKAALLTYQCHLSLCTMPRPRGKITAVPAGVSLPAEAELPALPELPGSGVGAQHAAPDEGEPFSSMEPKPNGQHRANASAK